MHLTSGKDDDLAYLGALYVVEVADLMRAFLLSFMEKPGARSR